LLVLRYAGRADLRSAIAAFGGQLSAALHVDPEADRALLEDVGPLLRERVGRLVFDGFPTGVAVGWAMQHGGPYPATTAPSTTSVGLTALRRFLRPVAWQDAPQALLPPELRDDGPPGLLRRVDGELVRA
jgi:NADP-dependent aldehyde dehydrogenase